MKKIKWILVIVAAIISNIIFFWYAPNIHNKNDILLEAEIRSEAVGVFELYYSDGIYDMEHRFSVEYANGNSREILAFSVPAEFSVWRMDFGNDSTNVYVYRLTMKMGKTEKNIPLEAIKNCKEKTCIEDISLKDGYIEIKTLDDDPHCMLDMNYVNKDSFVNEAAKAHSAPLKILACIAIDIILFFAGIYGGRLLLFLKELYQSQKLVLNLAKNDFKTKYVGSYLGIIWAFIQPIITVLVYWFVFQMGLKSGSVGTVPFVAWLIVGLVPWFFFSEALGGGTSALIEYQFLVKKIVFKISMLPMVKVISALFVHLAFIAFTIVLYSGYGYFPNVYYIQIVYYVLCNFIMVLGISYLTCSLVVFFRDTTQIINIILQVGIWMTPIMWQLSILPERLRPIFKLVPMYYIVDGFRDAFINRVWFFQGEKFYLTVWFWFFTLIVFGFGTVVFRKLKVHFADVL